MPERGYFETRTAIPGYTFILLILIINYQPLAYVLRGFSQFSSVFGALLAFVALLGGSAIGHLVSQVWWFWFQRKEGQYYDLIKRKEKSRAIKATIKKYKLTNGSGKDDIQNVLAVWGYVIHYEMGQNDMKEVLKYTTRRWDLFHLHSSIMVTLIVGTLLGALLRILSTFFIFEYYVGKPIQWENLYPEIGVWILLTPIVVCLFCFFWKSRKWINSQYDAVSAAIIKNSKLQESHMRAIFPRNYFQTSEKTLERSENEKKREV